MGFRPDEVAFVVFIISPDQFFELLLRLIKPGCVRSFRRRLPAPRCVGESELDPARFRQR